MIIQPVSVAVHKTVLELHVKTELQRSAKRLKKLEIKFKLKQQKVAPYSSSKTLESLRHRSDLQICY